MNTLSISHSSLSNFNKSNHNSNTPTLPNVANSFYYSHGSYITLHDTSKSRKITAPNNKLHSRQIVPYATNAHTAP
jgi:hypothetical protein